MVSIKDKETQQMMMKLRDLVNPALFSNFGHNIFNSLTEDQTKKINIVSGNNNLIIDQGRKQIDLLPDTPEDNELYKISQIAHQLGLAIQKIINYNL